MPTNSIETRASQRQESAANTRFIGACLLAVAPIIAGTGLGFLTLATGALVYTLGGWQSSERDSSLLMSSPEHRHSAILNEDLNAVSKRTANWSFITATVMALAWGVPGVALLAKIPMAIVAWNGFRDYLTIQNEKNPPVYRQTPPNAGQIAGAGMSFAH